MERALRTLRDLQPGRRIDLKELVVLGAREKAARLGRTGDDAGRRSALVEEFLALRADEHLDAERGLAVHESGWVRPV